MRIGFIEVISDMEFIIWKYKSKELESEQEKSEDAKKDSNKKKEGK